MCTAAGEDSAPEVTIRAEGLSDELALSVVDDPLEEQVGHPVSPGRPGRFQAQTTCSSCSAGLANPRSPATSC